MRLYDNDAYREDFVTGVYDVLSNDTTWERADQIIQLFDNAPIVEESPNEPLTLEELREMDGKPVWVKSINDDALFAPTGWAIVTVLDNGDIELDFFGRRDTWVLSEYSEDADEEDEEDEIEAIYRRKPEEAENADSNTPA